METSGHRAFEGLGPALRFLRKEKGWTLAQLGDATEEFGARLSAANLSRYERDLATPGLGTLERMLAALDVSLEELALILRRVRGEGQGSRRVGEFLVAALRSSDLVLTEERRAELIAEKRSIDRMTRVLRRVDDIFPESLDEAEADEPVQEEASGKG